MIKPWSISTTVRNPERLRSFLKILKVLEGKIFTPEMQERYQILLIKEKLYIPTYLPEDFKRYYDSDKEIPFEEAERLFKLKNYKDPPMRGRQSVNPLNKLGFAIARKGYGPIKITKLGDMFLNTDADIRYIFFKSLLKLQFPNPWSTKGFTQKQGFNIMPFIATLKLIQQLNESSKDNGMTRDEFSLFIPTLININDIPSQITRILNYRKLSGNARNNYIKQFAEEFYRTQQLKSTKINDLFDYGDNTMRYFRLTGYFHVTTDPLGNNWRIDFEPSRKTEIEQLISNFDGAAIPFKDAEEYLNYMSDLNRPELPWEEIENLKNVAVNLRGIVAQKFKSIDIEKLDYNKNDILNVDINKLNKIELGKYVDELRDLNRKIQLYINENKLHGNIRRLNEIIEILDNQKNWKKIEPENFEGLITEALKIVDDEKIIKPNYIMDDEGNPISHAPGNMSDIEYVYETFKGVCEVTLNTANNQWMQEGQPVMRHLRQFEKQNGCDENTFCIFIAPIIRTDTYSQFWISVKYEYDGKPQKIIPLTTHQFTLILNKFIKYKKNGMKFTNNMLFQLYESLIAKKESCNGYSQWEEEINQNLISWEDEKCS